MIYKLDEIKFLLIVFVSVLNNLVFMKFDLYFVLSVISNVFESVVKMKNDKMVVDKRILLQVQLIFLFGVGKLLKMKSILIKSEEMVYLDFGFYNCGVVCNYVMVII